MQNVIHDTNLYFAVAWERVHRERGNREREGGQELIAAARELHTNAHGHALRFERLRLRELSGASRR